MKTEELNLYELNKEYLVLRTNIRKAKHDIPLYEKQLSSLITEKDEEDLKSDKAQQEDNEEEYIKEQEKIDKLKLQIQEIKTIAILRKLEIEKAQRKITENFRKVLKEIERNSELKSSVNQLIVDKATRNIKICERYKKHINGKEIGRELKRQRISFLDQAISEELTVIDEVRKPKVVDGQELKPNEIEVKEPKWYKMWTKFYNWLKSKKVKFLPQTKLLPQAKIEITDEQAKQYTKDLIKAFKDDDEKNIEENFKVSKKEILQGATKKLQDLSESDYSVNKVKNNK